MGLFDWFTKKSDAASTGTKTTAPVATAASPATDRSVPAAAETETAAAELDGTWTIDPSHSSLGFVARHAMVTNVRGTFDEFEGSGVVDTEDLSASHATVVMQAASINTGAADRDAHLRSADFFDVKTYPEVRFSTTSVERVDEETFRLDGELTIKDVTRPLSVELTSTGLAKDPFGNLRAGFEGETSINRKDWGLTWNAALETGGVLVGEKIKLVLDISAIKSA
ncbi:polyisoprenoid-binding protein [Ornithinimicrobium sp. CNJ-824]|uniref:YceI family protein n=1 Tax=Ornithinimicrobium sp. CNJ-824 TaxID=1904966 RepID=UPI00095A1A60|nr:YceI family protein [Ornithinimicrobium sp. CNJ-824]OLT22182.1 polyisoprenoid-binding protein [Ornithinimicrobium sp. CNJ-824]